MKKLLLLLVICTTSRAGFITELLNNEEYTYEALGAMVYYQTHCSGLSEQGFSFASDAVKKYSIDTTNFHINNESYIKGWNQADETSDCNEVYDEFDNYWLGDLLNDPLP